MVKKIFKIVILILLCIGVILGISISIKREGPRLSNKNYESKIIEMVQTRKVELSNFYTYGRSINVAGIVRNVSKDNFESVKLLITNGNNYEKEFVLNTEIDENILHFDANDTMNNNIVLDDLEDGTYYLLLRLKVNNNTNPKYYSFSNKSNCPAIDYYSMTKDGQNKKIHIGFETKNNNDKEYSFLKIEVSQGELPENVYDIVIDAGHGGKDVGERVGGITEANIALGYAKDLKTKLEEYGYKVKLTRDDDNSDTYTYTNMYAINGRITKACESKAKIMISLHVNNSKISTLSGFEIYAPCKSSLDFAQSMANNIVEKTNINYSSNNSFKVLDGVYVRNFTKNVIKEYENSANKKGYEPYDITINTPYLYTIREVGGIATGAYVDGRNKDYDANRYYNSNQGIECYQIELGYIKNDLNNILADQLIYVEAIADAIKANF